LISESVFKANEHSFCQQQKKLKSRNLIRIVITFT